MRELFLDIGELGWSLYLSAHMKWLKANGQSVPAIMTLFGRECFYEDIAPVIYPAPDSFYDDFDLRLQNCFGINGVNVEKLKTYFKSKLPNFFYISEKQPLSCGNWKKIFIDQMLFEAYPYKTKFRQGKEILIFPRYRTIWPFASRNLPKDFYINLIIRLCDENKDCLIKTIGAKSGAYNITEKEVARYNYKNWVGKTANLQAVIERFQIAICTIGGTSALPKLALLQGVPSFIIGHEPERFKKHENWRGTKVGFYEIPVMKYNAITTTNCLNKVLDFAKGCQ